MRLARVLEFLWPAFLRPRLHWEHLDLVGLTRGSGELEIPPGQTQLLEKFQVQAVLSLFG